MTLPTIPATWTGEAFEPRRSFRASCDQSFTVGESYVLVPQEQRGAASHAQYFAEINEVFKNLPDHLARQFHNTEKLRKWALIRAGFCDQRSLVAPSKAAAERIAAFIEPMDQYAEVTWHDCTVLVLTAKSQSYKAMGRASFEESKRAVLSILASLIEVKAGQIREAVDAVG